MKRLIVIFAFVLGLCMCLCACSKDELKGHTFSSSLGAFTLSFGEESNATLVSTNLDTDRKTTADLTYKIEGDDLFLYADGIERITATIKEDGKLITITHFDGVDNLSTFSSTLYREDAKDLQESAKSSVYQEMSDEIERQL